MLLKNLLTALSSFCLILCVSCHQKETLEIPETAHPDQEIHGESKYKDAHAYGGWFCPDNLGGFPPLDVQQMDMLTVVEGRLPSREETRNGSSLMYFDPEETPDALPLDIALPRIATYYNNFSNRNELVIVIQAVVIGADTVVGFRYLNGGNGSSWYGEVNFLSDEEIAAIGPTPFIFIEEEIDASKELVWQMIAQSSYGRKLGLLLGEQAFFASDWTEESELRINYESDRIKATGMIANLFGNIYLQIDYSSDGTPYTEKILLMEQNGKTQVQVVSGPHGADFNDEQLDWSNWFQDIKNQSEAG